MNERQVQSSDDEQSVTGGHTTSMELAELIEEVIGQVTGEGMTGNEARHTVVERVMDQSATKPSTPWSLGASTRAWISAEKTARSLLRWR